MKIQHSGSFLLMLVAGALAVSCSDADTSQSTGSILGTPGGVPGGTAGGAGGTTAGAITGGALPGAAGGTGSLGSLSGTAGGTGAAGGTGPGGAITSVMIENKPCEKKVRTAGKTIPDFMIVLDRSASMRTTIPPNVTCTDPIGALLTPDCLGVNCGSAQWMMTTACGGTMPAGVDRWAPAVTALKSLTQMFEAKVNFGLTIFPGGAPMGGQNINCAAGMQRVPVGPNSAGPIAMALDGTQPAGFTPTASTLQAVLQQIQSKKTSPDEQLPPQFVLLVTDGAPTCNGNQFQPGSPQPHQQTVAAIDALAKAGVKTYVIGYDASVDAMLAAQLTEYAQHGGTNNFYAVQDGPSLVSKFSEITGVVADCNYALDKKPDDNKFVLVELDGKKLFLDDPNGWTIVDNNVTIQGESCATLRDGSRPHTLAVTVECVPQDLK